MAWRQSRMFTRVMVSCMVPRASMPSASGFAPTISMPSMSGMRWWSKTSCFTLAGSAVPPCVPMMRKAGPFPAMMTRAVPSPTMENGPSSSSVTVMVLVMRYAPFSKRTLPHPASTAA